MAEIMVLTPHLILLDVLFLHRQHVHGDSVWFSASLIFFFSFFSLSHTLICALSLKKIIATLRFLFPLCLVLHLLIAFFFWKIISNWKLFSISSSFIVLSLRFSHHSLDCYFFYLRLFIKLNFFCDFILFYFFFSIRVDPNYFYWYLSTLTSFLDWFFLF